MQLVLNPPAYIKWRTKIIDDDRKISEGITVLSQRIKSLERLVKDIEYQLNKEPSETILVKLNESEGELEKLKLENIKLKETIANLEEKLSKHIHKLDTLKKQNNDTNQNINILTQFVEHLQQLESREVEVLEVRKNLKAIKLRKAHIEEYIYHYRELKDKDAESFTIWEIQAKDMLKNIRAIISDAKLIKERIKSDTVASAMQPIYALIDEDFALYISSWDNLSKDMEHRNNQISLINKEIVHIEEKLTNAENNLRNIDKDWEQYEIIEGTEDNLTIKKELITVELKKTEEVLEQTSMERVAVLTKIDETKQRLGKIERKIKEEYGKGALIWADVNLDEKEYSIKKGLKESKEYLDIAEGVIVECQGDRANIKDIISDIRIYQKLDFNKGKISNDLMARIKDNPRQELDLWINKFDRAQSQLDLHHRQVRKNIEEFTALVREKAQDDILKNRILTSLEETKADRYSSNLVSFNSMKITSKRR